jgi:hypothetical protein
MKGITDFFNIPIMDQCQASRNAVINLSIP